MSEEDPSGDEPKPADYEVGYGKPPKKSQFRKGQSGNPCGRRRKTPAVKFDPVFDAYFGDVVLREAMRPVTMRENGQAGEISTLEAIVRAQNVAAIKGNLKAQAAAIGLVKSTQDRVLDGRREFYQTTMAYKERCRQAMAECDRYGVPYPEFLPHPDDIVIDERTQEVRFNGPRTPDEHAEWKMMRDRAADLEPERQRLLAMRARDPEHAAEIDHQLGAIDAIQQQTDSMFPDEATRRRPGFDLLAHRTETDHVFTRKYRKKPKRPPASSS